MGNVGDKILKHHRVADKTPGTEAITTTAVSYTHLALMDLNFWRNLEKASVS